MLQQELKNMLHKPENYRMQQRLSGDAESPNIVLCKFSEQRSLNFVAHCWVLLLIFR